jgi:hypothetical protein
MLKEVVDFLLLLRSRFYPDTFRDTVAILRGSWVPYKQPKWCSVLWACADCDRYRVANWPHGTGHNPYTPITQNTAWVAYKALTTPWGWQPYAETCRGRIWNVVIIKKSTTSLSICWSFYKWYYKMLGLTIKNVSLFSEFCRRTVSQKIS